MNIKYAVYESLTPRQRIIATIEAWARGDEAEGQRLAKTCPKVTCRRNESAYVERIKVLKYMATVIEYDMRGAALSFFAGAYFIGGQEKDGLSKLYRDLKRHPEQIRGLLSIHEAWNSILQEEGIDPGMMDKAMNGLMHGWIRFLVSIAEKHDVLADPEIVKEYKSLLRNYLDKVGG